MKGVCTDEVFKILEGFEDVDKITFFKSSSTELRGHSEKFYQGRSRHDCRYYEFFQRIVGVWNSLDDAVVECKTIISFKSQVNKWLKSHGYYQLRTYY